LAKILLMIYDGATDSKVFLMDLSQCRVHHRNRPSAVQEAKSIIYERRILKKGEPNAKEDPI
jgi:hypothetical protein